MFHSILESPFSATNVKTSPTFRSTFATSVAQGRVHGQHRVDMWSGGGGGGPDKFFERADLPAGTGLGRSMSPLNCFG